MEPKLPLGVQFLKSDLCFRSEECRSEFFLGDGMRKGWALLSAMVVEGLPPWSDGRVVALVGLKERAWALQIWVGALAFGPGPWFIWACSWGLWVFFNPMSAVADPFKGLA